MKLTMVYRDKIIIIIIIMSVAVQRYNSVLIYEYFTAPDVEPDS